MLTVLHNVVQGGCIIKDIRFADYIDDIAVTEDELIDLSISIEGACRAAGVEDSADKNKVM